MFRSALFLLMSCGMVVRAAAAPAATAEDARAGNPVPPDQAAFGVVVTEYTDEGRKAPAPAADRPVYYLGRVDGQRDFGRKLAGEKPPPEAAVQQRLIEALTAGHYLPATKDHPPSQFVIVTWGIHANVDPDTEDPGYRNLLERTAIVGGQKFREELREVLAEEIMSVAATPTQPFGFALQGMRSPGAAIFRQGFSPMETFRKKAPLNARLLEQISDDCYYVIVAAFDYASLTRKEKRLLWTSKLSTRAQGKSRAEAIPALIKHGAGHLGCDVTGPQLLAEQDK
jgi:hypothetical protein